MLKIDVKKAGEVKADVKVGNIAPSDVIRWTPKGYTDKKADSSDAEFNPDKGSKDGYNRYCKGKSTRRSSRPNSTPRNRG